MPDISNLCDLPAVVAANVLPAGIVDLTVLHTRFVDSGLRPWLQDTLFRDKHTSLRGVSSGIASHGLVVVAHTYALVSSDIPLLDI